MTTMLLVGIFLLLLMLVVPKVVRLLWWVGLTLAVWAVVLFALMVVQDISRHGF